MENDAKARRLGELNLKLNELLKSDWPKPAIRAELTKIRNKYGAEDVDWMLRVIQADVQASKGTVSS